MMNKKIVTAFAFFAAVMLFAAPAFAAETEITSVYFEYTYDDEGDISEGYNGPLIRYSDGEPYEIDDIECTSDTENITGKSAVSFKLTLSAKNGYIFAQPSAIAVSGSGITSITSVSRPSGDKTELNIKFKAYPYVKLREPKFITSFSDIQGSLSNNVSAGRGATLELDKNGAPAIEYVLVYTNQNGDEKVKHTRTTSSSIKVSEYNKQYTGSDSGKSSCRIEGVAIRAAAGSSDSGRVLPSDWVYISGGSTSLDVEDYFSEAADFSELNDISVSANAVNSGSSAQNGWSGSGTTWYYYSNGAKRTGWVLDGSNWYYLQPGSGLMLTGWFRDTDGHWYYLKETRDATYGCMLTGWVNWNGKYYYLSRNSGGPLGAMVVGQQVIDGKTWLFNSDGSLIM